jgi:hypothetical protein
MLNFLTQKLYEAENGEARLTLEQPEEPYLAGVRYSVQVPGKKCVAMDCLSGGEGTMASLAFLFALNRYCIQPPVEERLIHTHAHTHTHTYNAEIYQMYSFSTSIIQ